MIDPDVIERDLRANISDWPATIRWRGRRIEGALNSQSGLEDVLVGGSLEDVTLILVAPRSDFGILPEVHNTVELELRTGRWLKLDITNMPDRHDPNSPALTLILGSHDR